MGDREAALRALAELEVSCGESRDLRAWAQTVRLRVAAIVNRDPALAEDAAGVAATEGILF